MTTVFTGRLYAPVVGLAFQYSNVVFTQNTVRVDAISRGLAAIKGVITTDGHPAVAEVLLLDIMHGRVVARTSSDENGNYRFDGVLAGAEFTVVARDASRKLNAVVADRVIGDV